MAQVFIIVSFIFLLAMPARQALAVSSALQDAIHMKSRSKLEHVISQLREKGELSQIYEKDRDGKSAFLLACESRRLELVISLFNASPPSRSDELSEGLQKVAHLNCEGSAQEDGSILLFLLEKGADYRAVTDATVCESGQILLRFQNLSEDVKTLITHFKCEQEIVESTRNNSSLDSAGFSDREESPLHSSSRSSESDDDQKMSDLDLSFDSDEADFDDKENTSPRLIGQGPGRQGLMGADHPPDYESEAIQEPVYDDNDNNFVVDVDSDASTDVDSGDDSEGEEKNCSSLVDQYEPIDRFHRLGQRLQSIAEVSEPNS